MGRLMLFPFSARFAGRTEVDASRIGFSASMKLSEQDGRIIEAQLSKLLGEINQ